MMGCGLGLELKTHASERYSSGDMVCSCSLQHLIWIENAFTVIIKLIFRVY